MTVKRKITALVLTGAISLAALVGIGWGVCNSVVSSMNRIVDEQFIPLVQDQITPLLETDILPVLNNDVRVLQRMNRSIKMLLDADRHVYQCYVSEHACVTSDDEEEREAAIDEYKTYSLQFVERMELALFGLKGKDAKRRYMEAMDRFSAWREASKHALELGEYPATRSEAVQSTTRGDSHEAFVALREALDATKQQQEVDIQEAVTQLTQKKDVINEKEQTVAASREAVLEASRQARAVAMRSMWGFVVLGALAIAASVALGWLISRSILRPVNRLLRVSKSVAQGALDDIEDESGDESGELADLSAAFAEVVRTLKKMNGQIESLVHSAKLGELDECAVNNEFQGVYRDLVGGFSDVVEAFARPSTEVKRAMQEIAGGNLAARMDGEYRGEFATLQESINHAMNSLEESLRSVVQTSGELSDAATTMQTGSNQLAVRAEGQARAIDGIAASMEEVTAMSKQTAGNAGEARALSSEASNAARSGVESMNRLAEAVGKIRGNVAEQAKLVKSIDGIAFQTNLLALNAAVEAARAGEAGQGFAVVAGEVRSLAERTAAANQTTAKMITDAADNVEEGLRSNRALQEALNDICRHVEESTKVIAHIAAAAEEQSQGIEQIQNGIGEIEAGTQEAAASSKRSSGIASELNQNVAALREIVDHFKLSSGEQQECSEDGDDVAGESLEADASDVPLVAAEG